MVNLKQRDRPVIWRAPKYDITINGMVSELHRLNGFEVRPPYCRDHAEGVICYVNTRDLQIAREKEVEKAS